MAPLVSIVVLNYNGKKYLSKCFEALKNQSYPNYEVIMVDNNSSDGSVEFVKRKFSWVKILQLNSNLGFSKANNIAAKKAKGEYIIFLNNDTVVDRKWLEGLILAIKQDKDVAVCASKILFDNPKDIISEAGGKLHITGAGHPIGLGMKDSERFDSFRYVGYASGASMLVDKKIFEKLNGFDSDYFMYLEDVDFGWRCWLFGYKVLYVPSSVVYHKFGGTFSRKSYFQIYHGQNRYLNIIKNFELKNVLIGLFFAFLYDLYRILKMLKGRNLRGITAILKGNWNVLQKIPKFIKKRRYISKKRKIKDRDLYKLELLSPIRESIKEYFRSERLLWDR